MGKNGDATFSKLFLIGSISYLQVTMTSMKAWMNYKFSQVLLLVYSILFILAGTDDMHDSSEELGIRPDLTTD